MFGARKVLLRFLHQKCSKFRCKWDPEEQTATLGRTLNVELIIAVACVTKVGRCTADSAYHIIFTIILLPNFTWISFSSIKLSRHGSRARKKPVCLVYIYRYIYNGESRRIFVSCLLRFDRVTSVKNLHELSGQVESEDALIVLK